MARAILNDDPRQSPLARKTLEQAKAVLIPVTVFLELAWVLKSVGWNRSQIHHTLSSIADLANVQLDRSMEIRAALDDFQTGPADFADYLALHQAKTLGVRKLLTFDRKLAKTSGAESVG